MPILLEDIQEHRDYYEMTNFVGDMKNSEYKAHLNNYAFFFADSHGFVRHTLSDEPVATNKDQLDLLIEHLKSYRAGLDDADKIHHKG